MNFIDLLALAPVNRMAALVTKQTGCIDIERDLTKPELVAIQQRLIRKHKLLKSVLGVRTKAQHANLMYRFNIGQEQFRSKKDPRSFAEYVMLGRQIQALGLELAEMRKVRRVVYEMEHGKEASA